MTQITADARPYPRPRLADVLGVDRETLHDLRNSLNIVIGNLHILRLDETLSSEHHQALEEMEHEAWQIVRLLSAD